MRIRDVFFINPINNNQHYSDYINYIDTSSVVNGVLTNVSYLESSYPSRAQRLVNNNDILYSSVRPNLRHYYLYKDNYSHVVASTGFFILRNKNEKLCNTKFAYYFFTLNSVVDYLTMVAELSQSTFPACSAKDIGKVVLPDFNVSVQQRIASILSNYDQLIENNNRRIKILEDMAESLYKEWFVRFRFPGHKNISMGDGELGKIPVCFKVVKVKEVLDQYIGGGWGNDDFSKDFPIGAYVIRGTDFPSVTIGDVSTCPYRYHKKSNYESRVLKENDVVFEISGGTSEQPVGRAVLIRKGILRQFSNQVICASFCKLLRPNYKLITPNYFYYWLKYLYDTRIIDRYQLQSTGIINFKFEYFLKKGIVLLPPSMYMDLFEKKVKEIKEQIDVLSMQNSKLVQQRDALLPRLMSGKLEVKC